MKTQGLQKARQDLDTAIRAERSLERAKSLGEAEEAWLLFVEKFGRFFNKLAASAKGNPKSEGWLSRVTKQRSDDELLCYLLQARNSTEHSIEDIAEKKHGYFAIGGGDEIHIERLEFSASGRISGRVFGSPGTKITNEPPKLALLPITNRGVTYAVPTAHLGQSFEPTPIRVARAAIEYGEHVLNDAKRYCPTTSGETSNRNFANASDKPDG